jgi:hypothetical protein
MEKSFMAPVDSLAAEALVDLEAGVQKWGLARRSAWARFLMTLMLRMPEDIEALKAKIAREWRSSRPDWDEQYASARSANDPPTFEDFLASVPRASIEQIALDVGATLMDHEGVGTVINNMLWGTILIDNRSPEFLTSDRPLIHSKLKQPNSHIFLPIGPRRLFVAVERKATFLNLEKSPRKLIGEVNRMVVGQAKRFAYSRDLRPLRFVQNRFGRTQQLSLLERMASH